MVPICSCHMNLKDTDISNNVYSFPDQFKWDRSNIFRFQQELSNLPIFTARQDIDGAFEKVNEIYR